MYKDRAYICQQIKQVNVLSVSFVHICDKCIVKCSPEGIRNFYQFFSGPISECLLLTVLLCAVHIVVMVQIVLWAEK